MKELLSIRRYRLLLAGAAAFTLGLALASVGLSQRAVRGVNESIAAVEHSRELIAQLDTVLRIAVDAETGQRGYILTANEEFLQPYLHAAPRARDTLADIKPLLPAGGVQQKIFAELETAVAAKLKHADDMVALARARGTAEAARHVASKHGKELMDRVRELVAELIAEEGRLLNRRHTALASGLRANHRIMLGLVVTEVLLCVLIGVLLWQVSRARVLAKVCSWSRTIEFEGEWISFEQYLERRFGIRTSHGISPREALKLRDQIMSDRFPTRAN
ncbi:MAG TPA: CHASE3 domain-containing protein [Opitutus sp.]|nr:CHASE3 domain-containing protein [Opitutus sp.]